MSSDHDVEAEERGIYVIVALVCAPVVGAVLYENGDFDGGTTICLLLVAAAVAGFGTLIRRRPRLPRAHIHRD